MSKKPLLSVIIPVYNTGDIVSRIINRVLKQKMRDLELILVNDGSTDSSLGVLKKFAKQDKRVRVINQPNSGSPSGGRNSGLKNAKGKLILLLDSDDDIDPRMIPAMIARQQSTNADLVTCAIKEVYPDGKIFIPNIIDRSIDADKQDVVIFALDSLGKESSVIYNPCNRLFKNEIIRKNNLKYRMDLRFGEDLGFNLEYLQYVKRIEVMSQTFYVYYFGSPTSVFSKSALDYKYRKENRNFLWKFAKTSSDPAAHNHAVWVQVRWFLSYCKIVCLSQLDDKEKVHRISYACKHERFKKILGKNNLGTKRLLIIKITYFLVKRPRTLYYLIHFASKFF